MGLEVGGGGVTSIVAAALFGEEERVVKGTWF